MNEASNKSMVKIDSVFVHGLEPFTDAEMELIINITKIPKEGWKRITYGWQFHTPDDDFYSKKSLKPYYDAMDKWYDNMNSKEPEINPAILGYFGIHGHREYYIMKRQGKFYTFTANQFEYSDWSGMGGGFDIVSDIHEFTDIRKAIQFVISDSKKLNKKKSLMPDENQYQLTEAELMSPYEADEVFEKFGVKNAMLLNKEDLKKAFRNLAIKHHPDKGGNAEDMKKINSAYESLRVNDGSGDSGGTARVKPPTRQQKEDPTAIDYLTGLGEMLKKKLTSKNLPIKGKIGISITGFQGGWMQVSFFMINGEVGLFDIVKRGNKIRIHDPLAHGDDPEYTISNDPKSKSNIKEFDLYDIDGLISYIEASIKGRMPIQIGKPSTKKVK